MRDDESLVVWTPEPGGVDPGALVVWTPEHKVESVRGGQQPHEGGHPELLVERLV